MLKGIPKQISPSLLKALAEMGHGDLLVIADDFYPAASMGKNGVVIDADGIGGAEMLDAILTLMPLDTEFEEHPVMIMDVMEEFKATMPRPEVWDEFIEVVKKHEKKGEKCVGFIDRMSFYEKAKKAYVTISSGERQPYSCIILQKGVM